MLVKVAYTKIESLGFHFDESEHRTMRDLQYASVWAEYLVVWRKHRIEIYEDYRTPGKEWLLGHKHLAFVVPLKSSKARMSLYSFVDLTFCLTCPPMATGNDDSRSRSLLHRSQEGRNIFIFKHKCRTRALDWTWKLWYANAYPQYFLTSYSF